MDNSKLHQVEFDYTGFGAYPRLTCYTCDKKTLLKKPCMTEKDWKMLVQGFLEQHPSIVSNNYNNIINKPTRKIFPPKEPAIGEEFDFYADSLLDKEPFKIDEEVDVYTHWDKDGNFFGDSEPMFIGRAKITYVPQLHTGLYKARM